MKTEVTFVGFQEIEDSEKIPLFNIKNPNHEAHGSTVSVDTLLAYGLPIPKWAMDYHECSEANTAHCPDPDCGVEYAQCACGQTLKVRTNTGACLSCQAEIFDI